MAWLHAVPKPPEGSKRAKAADRPNTVSRLDRMKKDGVDPRMPPNPLPHIVARLVDLGLSEAAGMGVGPLSWLTIDAWQRATGVELAPWEARLVRRLSIAYVAEGRRAESENCPPPWHAEPTAAEKAAELRTLEMVLG